MDDEELTVRERMLDRYDSVVDWFEKQSQGFEVSNLTDWRNLWALLVGGMFGAFIPLYLLHEFAGLPEAVMHVLFWPSWVAWLVFGGLALGTVGVSRCRHCGKRLKVGHYTCRKCGGSSAPGRGR